MVLKLYVHIRGWCKYSSVINAEDSNLIITEYVEHAPLAACDAVHCGPHETRFIYVSGMIERGQSLWMRRRKTLTGKRSLSAVEEMKGWSANNYPDCKHINQFISRSNCWGFSAWPVSHSNFHLAATAPDIVSHAAAPQMILIPRCQTVEYFLIGGEKLEKLSLVLR